MVCSHVTVSALVVGDLILNVTFNKPLRKLGNTLYNLLPYPTAVYASRLFCITVMLVVTPVQCHGGKSPSCPTAPVAELLFGPGVPQSEYVRTSLEARRCIDGKLYLLCTAIWASQSGSFYHSAAETSRL